MLASATGWALIDHRPAAGADLADADLAEFAARFDADQLDLLLVEGFHRSRYPKIEVHRATNGEAPWYRQDSDIIAVVTDTRLPGDGHPPELPIDDPAAVADFIHKKLAKGCFSAEDTRDALMDDARWTLGSGAQSVHSLSASVRVGSSFWITPGALGAGAGSGSGSGSDSVSGSASGKGGALGREDLIAYRIDDDETPEEMPVDAQIHRCIYREQPGAGAVLHGHGVYSVAVSFVGRDFQPLDAESLQALGNVPVLSVDTHEKPDKAATEIAEALAGFPLCLVAGHGSYAWGEDLAQAAGRTELLERAAKIYVVARQAAAL